MGVRIKSKDNGAKAMLARLLKSGALSVGILEGKGDVQHVGPITGSEKKERKLLTQYAKRKKNTGPVGPDGSFVSQSQRERLAALDKKAKESQLTVAEIGAIHEFGLGTAPRRSFLADWQDENGDRILKVITNGARALTLGRLQTPEQFLEQFGAWAAGDVQRRMADNIPPPLSPITIRRKRSSVALIDTGQLRSSISYRVDAMNAGSKHELRVPTGDL